MLKKVGERTFKKYAWTVIVLFFVSTAFLAYRTQFVKLDYDFEKFFPVKDPETGYFLEYREKFTSDNDFLLIAIERKNGIFDDGFLKDVNSLVQQIEKVELVDTVLSITNLEEIYIYPNGISTSKKYFDFMDFKPKRDSARIYSKHELVKTFVPEDGKSLCVFVKHEDYLSAKKSDQFVGDIQKVLGSFHFEKVRIAGRTIGQQYYIHEMVQEMILYVGLGAVLVILFLFIAFRSAWGIILPLIVVMSSAVWLIGLMELTGTPINIILTVIPTIMFIVGMSDVIHLVSRYLDAFRQTSDKLESIKITLYEVGLSTFLTSFTTAVGFYSLYFVNVQPIKVFGIVMGFGVMLAFVLTYIVLPVLIFLAPSPKSIRKRLKTNFWQDHLRIWFMHVLKGRWKIIGVAVLISFIGLVGLSKIESNNFMMDDIRDENPLKQDFNFIDAHYGGFRPFELAVELKDSTSKIWDDDVLKEINRLEYYLENDYGVNIKNSLVTYLKVLNRSSAGGKPEAYELPSTNRKIKNFRRNLRIAGKGELLKSVLDSTERLTRISGTIPDWGNKMVSAKNHDLIEKFDSFSLKGKLHFQITGTAHLLDKNMSYLAGSLIRGLAISVVIVVLIISLIYRSFSIVLISLIPNLIPLIFIAGVMGFTGIELKSSTAIIFTIAFGIAVDDTIHLLGKFRFELSKGKSKLYALKRAYLTTGKAMILTTLILCAGFLLLVFSDFLGTFYMGVLLCITLFVALIADITLLPALLLMLFRKRN